ncbi:hypothetical protein ACFX13_009474 [Malus domestica]
MTSSSCSARNGALRQYVRSKVSRLRWTLELHRCFLQVIERLEGHTSEQLRNPPLAAMELSSGGNIIWSQHIGSNGAC